MDPNASLASAPEAGVDLNASALSTASAESGVLSSRRRQSMGFYYAGQRINQRPQLQQMFDNCLQLSAENKINPKNSWDLPLIDHLHEVIEDTMQGSKRNFHMASCTIDASVKIFSGRVDSLHSDSSKACLRVALGAMVLSSLVRSVQHKKADSAEDSAGNEGRARARGHGDAKNTLGDPSDIRMKKLDTQFITDPIFRRTCAKFDQGGAKGLLLNNLNVGPWCNLLMDAAAPTLTRMLETKPDSACASDDLHPESRSKSGDAARPDSEPSKGSGCMVDPPACLSGGAKQPGSPEDLPDLEDVVPSSNDDEFPNEEPLAPQELEQAAALTQPTTPSPARRKPGAAGQTLASCPTDINASPAAPDDMPPDDYSDADDYAATEPDQEPPRSHGAQDRPTVVVLPPEDRAAMEQAPDAVPQAGMSEAADGAVATFERVGEGLDPKSWEGLTRHWKRPKGNQLAAKKGLSEENPEEPQAKRRKAGGGQGHALAMFTEPTDSMLETSRKEGCYLTKLGRDLARDHKVMLSSGDSSGLVLPASGDFAKFERLQLQEGLLQPSDLHLSVDMLFQPFLCTYQSWNAKKKHLRFKRDRQLAVPAPGESTQSRPLSGIDLGVIGLPGPLHVGDGDDPFPTDINQDPAPSQAIVADVEDDDNGGVPNFSDYGSDPDDSFVPRDSQHSLVGLEQGVNAPKVKHTTVFKAVDVKKLKDMLWKELQARKGNGPISFKDCTLSMRREMMKWSRSAAQVSTSLIFICLLHLANENDLSIDNVKDY
eukprot:gene9520-1710_t